jgi:hypothetical protein
MREFNYSPTITGRVIKTMKEQCDKFFIQGHPQFLIPDFYPNADDIWITYMDYLEKLNSKNLWDQDGGEVHSYQILDKNTGLTKCIYTAYGIMFDEDSEPNDFDVEIEGYVVEVSPTAGYVFISTKVFEKSKL